MKTYFFVRHAHSYDPTIVQSDQDALLSSTDIKQVEALKERLRPRKFETVFCSPAVRAVMTSRILIGETQRLVVLDCLYGYVHDTRNIATEQRVGKYLQTTEGDALIVGHDRNLQMNAYFLFGKNSELQRLSEQTLPNCGGFTVSFGATPQEIKIEMIDWNR